MAVVQGDREKEREGEALLLPPARLGVKLALTLPLTLLLQEAVKVEVRDGLNPRRRLALKVQGRRDMPLTRVGEPMPLADLELSGAQLARFLGVPLEGV